MRKDFFAPKERREGRKLTEEKLAEAKLLLLQGEALAVVSQQTGISWWTRCAKPLPLAGSRRPDRVINHVRLCFLAYWLSARRGGEWRARGETQEVPRILRQLQTIRLGTLRVGQNSPRPLMTQIPKNLNEQLKKLALLALFAAPPKT